jgi:uncharacterized membrane protein
MNSKKLIQFQVYLHVSSETLEVSETKYLNASHWLISSVNSFYIGVGFIPFTVVTLSIVAVTLCNVAAVTIGCNTLQSGSSYQNTASILQGRIEPLWQRG